MKNDKAKDLLNRVLIIESDDGMRTLLKSYVQNIGGKDIDCLSSDEVATIVIEETAFDLIILDWKAKKAASTQLYKMIRESPLNQNTPLILTAASITRDDVAFTSDDACCKFVIKPCTEEVLVKQVNNLFQGKIKRQVGKQNNFMLLKGQAVEGGLDLSVHKGERAPGPEDFVDKDRRGPGFVAEEKDQTRPTGDDLLLKNPESKGFTANQESPSGNLTFEAKIDDPLGNFEFSMSKEEERKSKRPSSAARNPNTPPPPPPHEDDDLFGEFDFSMPIETGRKPNAPTGVKSPNNPPPAPPQADDDRAGDIDLSTSEESSEKPGRPAPVRKPKQSPSAAQGVKDPLPRQVGVEEGKKLAKQRKETDRSRSSSIEKSIADDIVNSMLHEKIQDLQSNLFNSSLKILIIEENKELIQTLKDFLKSLTSAAVDVVHNGLDAWMAIQENQYQMIILDWRTKGLNSLRLYNRLRSNTETRSMPIIVLSGPMNIKDFRILEESNCLRAVGTPLEWESFEKAVKDVFQANLGVSKISNVAGLTIDQARKEDTDLFGIIKSTSTKIPYRFEFFVAAGRYLSYLGEFEKAEKVLELALRLSPNNVSVMTTLARLYLRQKRAVESLTLLSRAREFSPRSIERLCFLGEAGLNLLQTNRVRHYFKETFEIDEKDYQLREGSSVIMSLGQYMESQGEAQPLNRQLASALNLVGVAQVRNGQIKAGIDQYLSALVFVHDSLTTARIEFNLSLAYLRSNDKKMAHEWLLKSIKHGGPAFPKAKNLFEKIGSGLNLLQDEVGLEESVADI